jgi:hypothetical protein
MTDQETIDAEYNLENLPAKVNLELREVEHN